MNDKYFDLSDAVENLVQQVMSYKSDTFSASEARIDRPTAEAMAAYLIRVTLFDANGCPGGEIDGATVGLAWDNVQEAKQAQIDSL